MESPDDCPEATRTFGELAEDAVVENTIMEPETRPTTADSQVGPELISETVNQTPDSMTNTITETSKVLPTMETVPEASFPIPEYEDIPYPHANAAKQTSVPVTAIETTEPAQVIQSEPRELIRTDSQPNLSPSASKYNMACDMSWSIQPMSVEATSTLKNATATKIQQPVPMTPPAPENTATEQPAASEIDHNSIYSAAVVGETAIADQDDTLAKAASLSLNAKLEHTNWKIRELGFLHLQDQLLSKLSGNPGGENINLISDEDRDMNADDLLTKYTEFLIKGVQDSNAAAQLAALKVLESTLTCIDHESSNAVSTPTWESMVPRIVGPIIIKALSPPARAQNKTKAHDVIAAMVYADLGFLVLPLLMPNNDALVLDTALSKRKNDAKVLASSIQSLAWIVKEFGLVNAVRSVKDGSIRALKDITSRLDASLLDHVSSDIRNAAKSLLTEICVSLESHAPVDKATAGIILQAATKEVKDATKKNITSMLDERKKELASSSLLADSVKQRKSTIQRERQQASMGVLPNSQSSATSEHEDTSLLDGLVEAQSLMEIVAQVKVEVEQDETVQQMPFAKAVKHSKWAARKSALDALEQQLATTPKFALLYEARNQDAVYSAFEKNVTESLVQIISRDSNVNVVTSAAKLVSILARGLKHEFPEAFSKSLGCELFKRLKEKNRVCVDAILAALENLHVCKCISIAAVHIDVRASLDSKTPKVRTDTMEWLKASILREAKLASNGSGGSFEIHPELKASIFKAVDDANSECRDLALGIIAVLSIVKGSSYVSAMVAKLDKLKLSKYEALVDVTARDLADGGDKRKLASATQDNRPADMNKENMASNANSVRVGPPGRTAVRENSAHSLSGPRRTAVESVALTSSTGSSRVAIPQLEAQIIIMASQHVSDPKSDSKQVPVQAGTCITSPDFQFDSTSIPEFQNAAKCDDLNVEDLESKSFKTRATVADKICSCIHSLVQDTAAQPKLPQFIAVAMHLILNTGYGLKEEPNFAAMRSKLLVIKVCAESTKTTLPGNLLIGAIKDTTLALADSKNTNVATDTLLCLAESSSASLVCGILQDMLMVGEASKEEGTGSQVSEDELIMGMNVSKHSSSQVNARTAPMVGGVLERLIYEFGRSHLSKEVILQSVCNLASRNTPAASRAAASLAISYKLSWEEIAKNLDSASIADMPALEKAFQTASMRNDTGSSPCRKMRFSCVERRVEEANGEAERNAENQPGKQTTVRTVISVSSIDAEENQQSQVSKPERRVEEKVIQLESKLADKNWKIRQTALSELELVLKDERTCIVPHDLSTTLIPMLLSRVKDPNKTLAEQAWECLAKLSLCFERSGCIQDEREQGYLQDFGGQTIAAALTTGMIDVRKNVFEAAMRCLNGWVDAKIGGAYLFVAHASKSLLLENSALRRTVIEWIMKRLTKQGSGSEKAPLAQLTESVLNCLRDRTSEVRKASELLLEQIVKIEGYDCVKTTLAKMPLSTRNTLAPVLDKYIGIPENEQLLPRSGLTTPRHGVGNRSLVTPQSKRAVLQSATKSTFTRPTSTTSSHSSLSSGLSSARKALPFSTPSRGGIANTVANTQATSRQLHLSNTSSVSSGSSASTVGGSRGSSSSSTTTGSRTNGVPSTRSTLSSAIKKPAMPTRLMGAGVVRGVSNTTSSTRSYEMVNPTNLRSMPSSASSTPSRSLQRTQVRQQVPASASKVSLAHQTSNRLGALPSHSTSKSIAKPEALHRMSTLSTRAITGTTTNRSAVTQPHAAVAPNQSMVPSRNVAQNNASIMGQAKKSPIERVVEILTATGTHDRTQVEGRRNALNLLLKVLRSDKPLTMLSSPEDMILRNAGKIVSVVGNQVSRAAQDVLNTTLTDSGQRQCNARWMELHAVVLLHLLQRHEILETLEAEAWKDAFLAYSYVVEAGGGVKQVYWTHLLRSQAASIFGRVRIDSMVTLSASLKAVACRLVDDMSGEHVNPEQMSRGIALLESFVLSAVHKALKESPGNSPYMRISMILQRFMNDLDELRLSFKHTESVVWSCSNHPSCISITALMRVTMTEILRRVDLLQLLPMIDRLNAESDYSVPYIAAFYAMLIESEKADPVDTTQLLDESCNVEEESACLETRPVERSLRLAFDDEAASPRAPHIAELSPRLTSPNRDTSEQRKTTESLLELSRIFAAMSSSGISPGKGDAMLHQLHAFVKQHPSISLDSHLSMTSQSFREYIRAGIARIDLQDELHGNCLEAEP